MLKSTHERVIENYTELLSLTNKKLVASKEVASILELRNCELNTKLVAARKQAEKLEDANRTIKELREIIKVLEKEKQNAKFCAGTAKTVIEKLNKKLEINTEAKRQIRDLIAYKDNAGKAMKTEQGTFVHEKVDGIKVWNLTMLIGE
jgi:hypothetical protein